MMVRMVTMDTMFPVPHVEVSVTNSDVVFETSSLSSPSSPGGEKGKGAGRNRPAAVSYVFSTHQARPKISPPDFLSVAVDQ